MKTLSVGWAAVLAAAVGISAAHASDQDASPAPVAEANPARAESGMRAYIDPETGQLTNAPATDAQRQQASSDNLLFREDDVGLVEIHKADGSSMIRLEGRYQQATVAQTSADGQLQTYCSDADHLDIGKHTHPVAAGPTRDER